MEFFKFIKKEWEQDALELVIKAVWFALAALLLTALLVIVATNFAASLIVVGGIILFVSVGLVIYYLGCKLMGDI